MYILRVNKHLRSYMATGSSRGRKNSQISSQFVRRTEWGRGGLVNTKTVSGLILSS
jgi:hypothetical protein